VKPYPKDWQPIYIENDDSDLAEKQAYNQKYSLYKLTREQFDELAERQGNSCAICAEDATGYVYRLAVDHDYETNEIRGLLCSKCNAGLAWFDDDPGILTRAVDYLSLSGTGVFIPETGSKSE
jgi:hypothetical protein